MTRAAHRTGFKEEQYIARMNLRFEKLLKQQIGRLEREKTMRTKGFHAERKPYEEKLESFRTRARQVQQTTADHYRVVRPGFTREKTVDRKLKDLRSNNRLATGAGYSYIEQLFGNFSKPLISRPIRWGINQTAADSRRTQTVRVPAVPRMPLSIPSSENFAAQSVERPKFARARRKPSKPVQDVEEPQLKNLTPASVEAEISEAFELSGQEENFRSSLDEKRELHEQRKADRLLPIPEDDEPSDVEPEVPRERSNPRVSESVTTATAKEEEAKEIVERSKRDKPPSDLNSAGCFVTLPLVHVSACVPSQYTASLDLAQPAHSKTSSNNSSARQASFKYLLHGRRSSL